MYRGKETTPRRVSCETFCGVVFYVILKKKESLFQPRHLLDGFHGKGQGTTHCDASHQAGIVVGEEAAGHIARDVQTFHRLVVGVQSLTLFIDGNALLSRQQRCAQPAAVERSLTNRTQAICRLAEIGILLCVVQFVVTIDGCEEGGLCLTGEAQFVSQLIQVSALKNAPAFSASSILPFT